MPEVNLTPASISYLNQCLLAFLITIYFGRRVFSRGVYRSQFQNTLLLGFFFCVTLFSLLLFLEVSLLPAERLAVVYLENTVLAILLVILIQFAYDFPSPNNKQEMERRVVLLLSCAYALMEGGVAVWRFLHLRSGQVEFRSNYLDIVVALEFLWVVFVFTRCSIQNWRLPSSRRFAFTFIIPFGLAVMNFARSYYAISTSFFQISLSVGMLFTTFFFAVNYLISQPERTSFIAKLSGVILTSVMAVLGTLAWLAAPAYASQYSTAIVDRRTIHFIPDAQGGYEVAEVPFQFEEEIGEPLELTDNASDRQSARVDFTFPFFGQVYDAIYVTTDGVISAGSQITWREYQYHFTDTPLIIPLLVDLNPTPSLQEGVFLRRDADRLVITYSNVPAYNPPHSRYTFQVILLANGEFIFSYNGLPDFKFSTDDRPESTVWAMGIKPAHAPEERASFNDLPMHIGPQGLIQDEYRSFRNYMHLFMLPFAFAVPASSLAFLVGLPLLFNFSFARPLNTLLDGVKAFNGGQRELDIPIHVNDEIGYLTESFNRLGAELNELIANLESRVAARTFDLREANEQLRKLSIAVEQSPSSIIITDTNGRIEYVNPAFTVSTGYTFDEVKGQNPRILKSDQTPPEIHEQLWQTISSGGAWRGELINRRKNGDTFWEYTMIAPIFNTEGKTTHYVAVKEDITERVLAEQALRDSEERYRQLFDLESDAILIIRNSDGQILMANTAAVDLYGFNNEELLALRNTDLSAEPQETQKATNNHAPSSLIIRIPRRWHRKKDGTVFPVSITARFVTWKGESVHIAAIRDITEQHLVELELVKLATTDPLTGLFNRRYFFHLAQEVFSHHESPLREVSLIWLDLDHFKKVNDIFGHDAGDIALVQVTALLRENIRPNDFLARFGGEEFIILLPHTSSAEAMQVAERLNRVIAAENIQAGETTTHLTASIGVATTTPNEQGLDLLLHHSDKALYMAKRAGRNCCILWNAAKITNPPDRVASAGG